MLPVPADISVKQARRDFSVKESRSCSVEPLCRFYKSIEYPVLERNVVPTGVHLLPLEPGILFSPLFTLDSQFERVFPASHPSTFRTVNLELVVDPAMAHLHKQTKIPQQEILPLATDIGALGNRINFNTRSEHNSINRTITLKFAIAIRDARIYRQGIQAFYHVFRTVEELINKELSQEPLSKTGEILKQIWRPEIARTAALEQDLMFFYGNDRSKFEHPIRQEQIDFVQHIYDAYKEKPHILLAYCHVMYLALFAGGKIMLSSLTRASGVFPRLDGKTTEEVSSFGTNLFKFQVEDDEVLRLDYKKAYELATRNALTEQEKLDIIDESKEIYKRNVMVVQELERHNREKITSKLTYKVFNYGYYVAVALLLLITAWALRRVVNHLLF